MCSFESLHSRPWRHYFILQHARLILPWPSSIPEANMWKWAACRATQIHREFAWYEQEKKLRASEKELQSCKVMCNVEAFFLLWCEQRREIKRGKTGNGIHTIYTIVERGLGEMEAKAERRSVECAHRTREFQQRFNSLCHGTEKKEKRNFHSILIPVQCVCVW